MADVFLSYKKVDKERVVALATALEIEGFTVWWDHELETGQKWLDRILEEVDIARALVGLWTVQSVQRGQFVESADSNNYLLTEHMRAGANKVLGALYDPGAIPSLYVGKHVADLVGWDGVDRTHPGFVDLVVSLESKATPPFAARRILKVEGRLAEVKEEVHLARVQADERAGQVQRLVRDQAGAKERAERLAQELGMAERAVVEAQRATEDAARAGDVARAAEAKARRAAAQVRPFQALAAAGWGLTAVATVLWASGKDPVPEPHAEPVPEPTQAALAAAPVPAAPLHTGSEWAQDPLVGWMRRIPGGTFTMGSPPSEGGYSDEQPQHQVTVSAYWLLESEVTQRLWLDVMGTNPSNHTGCLDCPVENVSRDEVQAFITALNLRTGKTYRLPTEAEWEFAARGNQPHIYAGANEPGPVAWYAENAGGQTHPVCGKQRNGFGLCDMSGNVWEWCLDGKRTYTADAVTDPRGPLTAGSNRVNRGGSFGSTARYVRVANRDWNAPSDHRSDLGLRLARSD